MTDRRISTPADLDAVLGDPEVLGSSDAIVVGPATPSDDAYGSGFFNEAIQRLCAAGLLPPPREPLPDLGARVEVMMVGGKPPPKRRYGVGVIASFSCDQERQWRVHVRFDESAGGFYGNEVLGSAAFPWMVHVVGGAGQPFSTMSPSEIEKLYDTRARARVQGAES